MNDEPGYVAYEKYILVVSLVRLGFWSVYRHSSLGLRFDLAHAFPYCFSFFCLSSSQRPVALSFSNSQNLEIYHLCNKPRSTLRNTTIWRPAWNTRTRASQLGPRCFLLLHQLYIALWIPQIGCIFEPMELGFLVVWSFYALFSLLKQEIGDACVKLVRVVGMYGDSRRQVCLPILIYSSDLSELSHVLFIYCSVLFSSSSLLCLFPSLWFSRRALHPNVKLSDKFSARFASCIAFIICCCHTSRWAWSTPPIRPLTTTTPTRWAYEHPSPHQHHPSDVELSQYPACVQ